MAYELIITMFAGFMGGMIRAIVGILKWQVRTTKTKKEFSIHYFLATFLLSGMLGLIAGLYIQNDPRFAILAGYAGTDFVEGLYRVKFKQYKKNAK